MQMKKGLLAVGLAIGLGVLSSNASAMTVQTGMHWADAPASYHSCQVVNVSNAAITDLQIVLHKSDGTVAGTSGVFTLPPGQMYQVVASASYSGFARCRIYSPTAAGSQIRGNMSVFFFNVNHYETLATEVAR